MPLIRTLEISRYKSTAEANAVLTRLAEASGWQDHVISRLAIARSLQVPMQPNMPETDRKGKEKELRGETLFRSKHDPDFLPWIAAMIAQHLGRSFTTDEEAVRLVIAHWERGISLLNDDLERHGGDFNEMLLTHVREANERMSAATGQELKPLDANGAVAPRPGSIKPMTVPIGRLSPDTAPVTVTLNDTRRHSNSHVAVSGMSGSGKTQLVKQMLTSAMQVCDETTGVIFIDYAKGDVATDEAFVKGLDARVVHLPGDILPVGPFHLPEYSDDAIRLAAEEKREVYTQLFRNLGPKQEGRLVQAIRSSYSSLGTDDERAPDFRYVQHMLHQIYENEGIQPDSLTELLRRLTAYELFWSRSSGEQPVSPIHTQRWVIDIHELGGLREVTAFTLIEQLYREMRNLPESEVDPESHLRHVRCILVIDEAQYYLKAKNRFLQGIIREGRSKGFAVMLMCQSPDDFDQDDFDYTEQLQFTYMLQCKTEPKAVQRLFGISRDEAKRFAAELGRMEPLHGLGHMPHPNGARISKFRIVPFFETRESAAG